MNFNILLLFLSLNNFASVECTGVDLNQISDDKISEYTHCFKDAEVTTTETPKAKFTPVCERSTPVKLKLEEIFNYSCEQITKDMLFTYNGTFEIEGQIYRNPKPGDLSGMNNLKQLALVNNKIETLPTGFFDDLENLRSLDLTGNRIEEFPISIFGKLFKLARLILRQNNIKKLPFGIFDDLKSLNNLNIAFNDINVISNPIISTPDNSLKSLGLHSNPITHLYNSAFKNMSKLKYLDLSQTKLSVIGKYVFYPLGKLQELEIALVKTDNTLINGKADEPLIYFDDISVSQFNSQTLFHLKRVNIYDSVSLMRNQKFIDQLKAIGIYVQY